MNERERDLSCLVIMFLHRFWVQHVLRIVYTFHYQLLCSPFCMHVCVRY